MNPRLAAVYNVNDKHIFKIQYSHSFRPPTFFELYLSNNLVAQGNPDIKPERVHSTEVGYVHNNAKTNTNFRFTGFYSHLHDLITINNDINKLYVNQEEVSSFGVEVELSQKITEQLTIDANGTYIDVKDESTDSELTKIANILGNLNLIYTPIESVNVIFSDHYTGKHKREAGDTRSSLSGYHTFNGSVSFKNIIVKKSTLNLGIKNIFDTKILHPSPLISPGLPSYSGDYPRPGREIWLNVQYKY